MTDLSNTTIESDADVVVVFEKESFFDLMIQPGSVARALRFGHQSSFCHRQGTSRPQHLGVTVQAPR